METSEQLVSKGLILDFGLTNGQRTIDRTPEWFLEPEHRHYRYEWFLTGKGSPFRKHGGFTARMSVLDRLDLALELLDLSEVQLWTELGWNIETYNLANLRSGKVILTPSHQSAIAAALSISPDWLRHGLGPMVTL